MYVFLGFAKISPLSVTIPTPSLFALPSIPKATKRLILVSQSERGKDTKMDKTAFLLTAQRFARACELLCEGEKELDVSAVKWRWREVRVSS